MSGAHAIVLMMNEFVHRSRCTLTRLTIHNPILTSQIFIKDCLLLMNSLVSLEIGPLWNVEAKVIFDALLLPNSSQNCSICRCGLPSHRTYYGNPLPL